MYGTSPAGAQTSAPVARCNAAALPIWSRSWWRRMTAGVHDHRRLARHQKRVRPRNAVVPVQVLRPLHVPHPKAHRARSRASSGVAGHGQTPQGAAACPRRGVPAGPGGCRPSKPGRAPGVGRGPVPQGPRRRAAVGAGGGGHAASPARGRRAPAAASAERRRTSPSAGGQQPTPASASTRRIRASANSGSRSRPARSASRRISARCGSERALSWPPTIRNPRWWPLR